ncbi:hypothetical protein ABK040_001682 [Willaertia magna]
MSNNNIKYNREDVRKDLFLEEDSFEKAMQEITPKLNEIIKETEMKMENNIFHKSKFWKPKSNMEKSEQFFMEYYLNILKLDYLNNSINKEEDNKQQLYEELVGKNFKLKDFWNKYYNLQRNDENLLQLPNYIIVEIIFQFFLKCLHWKQLGFIIEDQQLGYNNNNNTTNLQENNLNTENLENKNLENNLKENNNNWDRSFWMNNEDLTILMEGISFTIVKHSEVVNPFFIEINLDSYLLNYLFGVNNELQLEDLATIDNINSINIKKIKESELMYTIGLFTLELLLSNKINNYLDDLNIEKNENNVCDIVMSNNSCNGFVVRFLTSVLHGNLILRGSLENVFDIELIHWLSLLPEKFPNSLQKFILNDFKNYILQENNTFINEKQLNLYEFIYGIINYGLEDFKTCSNYLQKSIQLQQDFNQLSIEEIKTNNLKFTKNNNYLYTHCALAFISKSFIESENYEKSIKISELALNHKKCASGYFTIGFVGDKTGEDDLAIEMYNKTLSIYPGYAMANNNIGIIYHSENKELSRKYYKQSIEIDPSNFLSYYNIALTQSDMSEEITYYIMTLRLNPNYFSPWSNLARALGMMGNFQLSIDTAEVAMLLKKNDAATFCHRGYSYICLGKFREALNDYWKCIIDLAYKERFVYYNIVLCCDSLKENKKGLFCCSKMLEMDQDDDWALQNRAKFYERLFEYQLALEDIEKVLLKHPTHANATNVKTRLKRIVNLQVRIH